MRLYPYRSLSSRNGFPVSFGLAEVLYRRTHTHTHTVNARVVKGWEIDFRFCVVLPLFSCRPFYVANLSPRAHTHAHPHTLTHTTHPNRIPLAVLNSFCCHRRRWRRRLQLSPKLTHQPRFCLFLSPDDVGEWWWRRSFMCVCIYRSLKARPKMRKSVEVKRFCIQTKATGPPPLQCESH